MKVAIITDTHFGIRNDSEHFHDNTKKFLDEIFFPYIKNENITKVFHLGDLVDRRKYINFNTSKRLRKDFLEPLHKLKLETHIILGNHDVFHKNTNETNAIEELVDSKYDNFVIYYEPTEICVGGLNILMLPWICDENRERTEEAIRNSKSPVCMGHLELSGFEMFKGSMVSHGDDPETLKKFKKVLSGHYHHRSNRDNIYYLGSHAEFTWSDFDDPKGFHVFDTDTLELEFIENPFKMFKKVVYDDSEIDYSNYKINCEECRNKIVKVVVKSKNNPFYFDKFIDDLDSCSPIEYQIIENSFSVEDTDLIDEAESTIDIFKNYITGVNLKNVEKKDLEKLIVELYNEALST